MRTIDADKAIEVANDLYEKYNFAMACADTQREINHIFKRQELFKAVKAVIEHCPTIDPVKHARWERYHEIKQGLSGTVGTANVVEYEVEVVMCSECTEIVEYESNYCPNCGAIMEGDKE